MGLKELINRGALRVWEDIYDSRLDDKAAPNLHDVHLGREASIYADPKEFFEHTYITNSMRELVEEVAEALKGGRGGRIFLLTSLFGGGKTHTLITLYHAFKDPESLKVVDEELAAKVAEVGDVHILVMDASSSRLVPHPDEPLRIEGFTIKTIWGTLAYRLGAYSRMRGLDDEHSPAPDVEPIRSVLSEAKGPVLILMDEIVHYIFNMYKSRLRDYGDRTLLFLDYLARAVEAMPRVALVASVQAEYRMIEGQRQLFEEETFKGYAEKVLRALSRETSRIVVPVAPDDVVRVLQKRIFREIPEGEAWRAQDRLHRSYREAPEIFGVESDWQFSSSETGRIATARETYPFHPKYVEVLREFVSRNRDLQKTRDAIRLTRKAVRRVLRGATDPGFIMPWHLDLRDRDIRARVLSDSYGEFRDVASRDIVSEDGRLGSVADCSKPQLALMMATAILLKTYTYETFKEPLKVFPDLKGVALMAYEPETFGVEGWQAADLKTTLEEMEGRLPHLASDEGRYWFTPYPSVIEYVEKRAEEKLKGPRISLYRALKGYAGEILVRKEGRKAPAEDGAVFSEAKAVIIGYGHDFERETAVDDDRSMKLVVYVKPEVKDEEVRRIILQRPGGGKRIYANTVAVIYPRRDADFEALLRHVASIEAAREIMETIGEYYRDREIRGIQEKKLKKHIDEKVKDLSNLLLSILTMVAYPRGEDVEEKEASPSTSIISQAEILLKDARTGEKLRTEIGFKDLADFLKNLLKWDLVDGDRMFEFREILDVFYTNTAAPFTTRKAVERSILSGVESLEIGIKAGDRLYWKQVGPEAGAERLGGIRDVDVVVPFRIAAKMLMERLTSETGIFKEPGGARRVWYEVTVAGRSVPLADLIHMRDWEVVLKEGVIFRKEELIPRGFILGISPSQAEVEPGRLIEALITVDPVGGYSDEVAIMVGGGSIETGGGVPPLKIGWRIKSPEEPGEYPFTVKATGADGTVKDGRLLIKVLSPELEIEVGKVDLMHSGAKLVAITTEGITPTRLCLNIAPRLGADAKATIEAKFGGEASFRGENMDLSIARLFVEKFNDILSPLPTLMAETTLKGAVRFKEPLILDSPKITALIPLSEKAKFKLRVKR
jgi:predicted AAA+ superfamily ATPase